MKKYALFKKNNRSSKIASLLNDIGKIYIYQQKFYIKQVNYRI